MRVDWELIGREDELDRIAVALKPGDSYGVLINGEPGIGKTRLARQAIRRAHDQGAHTEWVAATRAAALLPFGALLPLIPGVSSAMAIDNAPVEALSTALRIRAGDRPVVLGIDDAHWLDDGAAAIVHFLTTTGQAKVVMTTRENVPLAEPLTGLSRDDLTEWIELRRLTVDEVGELVGSVLHGPVAASTVTRLWEQSEGNPLMLRELVQQSIEEQRFSYSGVLWHWDGLVRTGPRLRGLIDEHLRRIPEVAQQTLRLVGFGQPLNAETLHRLADLRAETALVSEGLIEFENFEQRTVVRVAHPLYAEFVRENTSPPEALDIMRQLAIATMDVGDLTHQDELHLARWWVDTGEAGDQDILAAAAAHSLILGHTDSVMEFAQAALELGPHFGAALALAEVGSHTLRDAELWQLFDEARSMARTDIDLATWAIAALRRFPSNFSDPEFLANVADDVIGELQDTTLQDLVRGQLAICFAAAGRSEESRELASELLASADDHVRIRALSAGAVAAILGGRGESILTLSGSLLKPSFELEAHFPGTTDLVKHSNLGALLALGRFDELLDLLLTFQEEERGSRRVTFELDTFGAMLVGFVSLMRGQMRTAVTQLREAFDLCRQSNSMFLGWTGGLLIQALATLGEMDEAIIVDQILLDLPPVEPYDTDRNRAWAWLLVGQGDLRAARARFLEIADLSHQQGRFFYEMAVLHDTMRIGADDVAQRVATVASQIEGAWSDACGAHALAVLSGEGNRLEAAGTQWEEAGFLLHAADAFVQAADAYSRSAQHAAARRAGANAQRMLDNCEGASTPLTTRRTLADPLTDRELEVSTLAAKGLASKQIAFQLTISVRTVDNLLLRAYRKLGISGRSELPGALRRTPVISSA